MCGRYVRRSDKQRIAEHFHVYGPSVPDFGPSWNVAPQAFQPIVRLNRDTREREIVMMRWGLIPYCILGERPANRPLNHQCQGRDGRNRSLIPRGIQEKAMSGSGRRLPGMAKDRCQDQETLCYRIEIW
jgi:hypothetical protein